VNLYRTRVGIDLSGARIALVAVRASLGGTSVVLPPLLHEFRSDRESGRREEAEAVLGEFVARNGLVGADAYVVLPAARVHMARAAYPPLRDKDLGEAVGLELERLFAVPSEALRYGFRRLSDDSPGGKTGVVVAAVSGEYLDHCGQLVSRAGLTLAAATPAGWAGAAAAARVRGQGALPAGAAGVLLRWLGDAVECTVQAGRDTLFSACRSCPPDSAAAEGIDLALAGLADAPAGSGEPVTLLAPAEWFPEKEFRAGPGETAFRARDEFVASAAALLGGPAPQGADRDPFPLLCAYGAAAAGREIDLFAGNRSGEASRTARTIVGISAAAALLLGAAWPATVAWKAKSDLKTLDSAVASLQPYAAQYETTLGKLDATQAKIAVLREEAAASREPLGILKELTDRTPNGTWIVSLRVEGRKIQLEGVSPSASEIFTALTKDDRFRSVDFAAPITRQGDNLERFKIRGEYAPPAAPDASVSEKKR
jgi:Fimbrial assembly protein (PilN)